MAKEKTAQPKAEPQAQPDQPADQPAHGVTEDNVVTGSRIEPLSDEEKAGPRSVQSKEIRPDEVLAES